MKRAKIVGLTLVATLVVAVAGLISFFYYMSVGELISFPPGGKVTVAFSDEADVEQVLLDICHVFPSEEHAPTDRRIEYAKLLAAGRLVQVPDGTPIILRLRGERITQFRFRSGAWKGREGRACSGSVVLNHAYP